MKKLMKLMKLRIKIVLNIDFNSFIFAVLVGDKRLQKDKYCRYFNYKYFWLIKISIFKKYFSLFLFNRSIIDYNKRSYKI